VLHSASATASSLAIQAEDVKVFIDKDGQPGFVQGNPEKDFPILLKYTRSLARVSR
jgi:N-ethylmaleimide reductase